MGLCARSEDSVEGELLVLHLGHGGKTTIGTTSLEEKCRMGLIKNTIITITTITVLIIIMILS